MIAHGADVPCSRVSPALSIQTMISCRYDDERWTSG